MHTTPVDPLIGQLVDERYRVETPVGSGGYGAVYAARHVGLGSKVAFKVLKLPVGLRAAQLAKLCGAFLDEARVLRRLRHPNIVTALDVGLLPAGVDGIALPYLVVEWCSGPPLDAYLRGRAGVPLPLGEALALFLPIVDAIAHAHAHGVAHRDIKPSNVLLDAPSGESLRPRVVDFGIAKLFDPGDAAGSGETLTVGGSPFTPLYASPEQLAGARTGPWTDVHALALLFVELVTGRPAVDPTPEGKLASFDPERPTPGRRGVDVDALEPVLEKALALKPSDRYPDAAAFGEALRVARVSSLRPLPPLPPSLASSTASNASGPSFASAPTPPAVTDPTAPPASKTLQTSTGRAARTAPSERTSTTKRVAIAVLGALALASLVGVGVTRFKPAAPPRPRLRDVAFRDIEARAEAAHVGGCTSTKEPDFYVVSCGNAFVMGRRYDETADGHALLESLSNAYAGNYKKVYGDARFAIDGPFSLVVAAKPDRIEEIVKALVGDAAFDALRAPTDLGAAPPRSDAAKAALRAWKSGDLHASVAALGMTITSAILETSTPSLSGTLEGQPFVVELFTGDASLFELYRKNIPRPYAYAIDGDKMLVALGNPSVGTEAFMKRLLAGAQAEVHAVAPN